MKFIIFLSIYLLTGTVFAQSIRYNKTYDYKSKSNLFGEGLISSDSTIITDGAVVNLMGYRQYGIFKFNVKTGDTIWTSVDSASEKYNGGGNSLVSFFDKSIYGCGYYYDTVGVGTYAKAFINKYDSVGNIIWKKRIFFGNQIGFAALQITSDSNLIFAGEELSSGNFQLILIKTDTAANILWKRNFAFPGKDIQPYSLERTADNGYLVSGYYWPSMFGFKALSYVIKTDSAGNMQWQKILGTQPNSEASFCKVLKNNDILLYGGRNTDTTKYDALVYRLDPLGDTVWSKKYLHNSLNIPVDFSGAVELSNGDIVFCGNCHNPAYPMYVSTLYKINSTGDSLWSQYYHARNNDNYFTNLVQLSNGDFLITGYVFPDSVTTEDGWLVRTDSMGCLVGGCNATGIEQIEAGSEDMSVYPNPATNQMTIEFDASSPIGTSSIEIKNVLGQTVKTFNNVFTKGTNKIVIDVSDLSSGLYFVQMQSENKMISKKFIKQ